MINYLSLKMRLRNNHQEYMLTGFAQMMHCWEAGPHRSQLTEGGRTATPEPGGDGCTEEEEGEEEEEERKVLSQQHEWIQTGGREWGRQERVF